MLRVTLRPALRPYHHRHAASQPFRPQRQQHGGRRQRQVMTQEQSHSSNTTDDALVSSSRLMSASVAQKHRANFAQMSQQQQQQQQPQQQQRTSQTAQATSRTAVSQAIAFRETKNVAMTQDASPLQALPSARLLRKLNYSDALKFTSPSMLKRRDMDAGSASTDFSTVRLQSYAHNERVLNPVNKAGTGHSNKAQPNTGLRCVKCCKVFLKKDAKVNSSVDIGGLRQARGNRFSPHGLDALPDMKRLACPGCGSLKIESLMQHLHVKANARKL